jgi:1-acyl-sn-glycerol-3-phosphate acyltransferase
MSDPNRRRPISHLTSGKARPNLAKIAAGAEFPLRQAQTPKGHDPLPSTVGPNYDTSWARRYPARLARWAAIETVGRGLIKYYARPTISGLDRLHDLEGGAIFAANHQSHADTIVMITSVPEPWRHKLFVGAAADYFFGSRFASVMSSLFIGAIPIERTSVNRNTIEKAVNLLRGGWSMVIYPEGGRSPDGWGQEFRPGAAFLAKQAGVPVVPVHIRGTFDILRKGRNWPKRAHAQITFGRPIEFAEDDNNRRFTRKLQAAVEALADESSSGNWWEARKRAHGNQSPDIAGPEAASWRRRWALTEPRSPKRSSSKRRWPYV